ncbi:MAG TPA: cysteine dioxygenase family protein [Vicinamibacterales bacterium]|nr:cysteine dioxygenase family protein [Vicinamibacterales bacterium]
MTPLQVPSFEDLRGKLDAAVRLEEPAAIARQVKTVLQETLRCDGLHLPAVFQQPRPDTYARRLLHRDPDGRYTAVVMTWGPGQGTPLHDHAGIWCVECVVDGEMEVRQYDLVHQEDGRYRFEPQATIDAIRGSAGCLIPPYEYHTLANRRPDAASITLHIYGGDMTHCHVFEPQPDGTYIRQERQLSYHES